MSLTDVQQEHVLKAIEEFDNLGRDTFMDRYGSTEASRYVVVYRGKEYDLDALARSAHGSALGTPPRSSGLTDPSGTVAAHLAKLGFYPRDVRGNSTNNAHVYGEVAGCPEGTTFASRAEVAASGVHRALQAGIVGTGARGAESIVSSGGYVDDDDRGDELIYTGHGGRNDSGRQVADQTFTSPGNAALLTSRETGALVRVVRGADPKSPHAPNQGYRYEGLYRVQEEALVPGQGGHLVCRFQMVKVASPIDVIFPAGDYLLPSEPSHTAGNAQPGRKAVTTQRIVRTTKIAEDVKKLYDHRCQLCDTRLSLGDGRGYSEGAHIKALGGLHRGPDLTSNVLCLCPNCHVQFDRGAVVIAPDRTVLREGAPVGRLRELPGHGIDDEFLTYHRDLHSRLSLR
ncbi:YDG/SRA domain-containing protein [Amycolatopsis sp. NPDC049688]|uniref:YDG/SRA domain-containing protein n=1 Tax=Amycolatopsis sp. NPDC049688 TaxID=3154733 RepID=UPI00343131D3